MTAPRRLLFVLPDLGDGGAPRVTVALLAAMDPARYQLSLLNLGARNSALAALLPPQVQLLHRPRWMPSGLIGARWATLWHGRDHDLLIAGVEMRATFCVHWAARLLRKPALAWVHIAFAPWAAGFAPRHRHRSRAAYDAIPSVVFVSDGARASMRQWRGVEAPHWRTIPNLLRPAGDPHAVPPAPAQQRWLHRLATRPTVIGIGKLDHRKGFDRLLQAAANALALGVDFDVVILGDGPLMAALQAQAQRLNIADRVALPGHVADPLPWLRAAQLYVLSSRLEGLPTTILEAFACATPVIANDCASGPAELLADGAGVLVPEGDIDAMAVAIVQLLASPDRRRALAQRGLQALERHRPEHVLPQWDEIIDIACHQPPPR